MSDNEKTANGKIVDNHGAQEETERRVWWMAYLPCISESKIQPESTEVDIVQVRKTFEIEKMGV